MVGVWTVIGARVGVGARTGAGVYDASPVCVAVASLLVDLFGPLQEVALTVALLVFSAAKLLSLGKDKYSLPSDGLYTPVF